MEMDTQVMNDARLSAASVEEIVPDSQVAIHAQQAASSPEVSTDLVVQLQLGEMSQRGGRHQRRPSQTVFFSVDFAAEEAAATAAEQRPAPPTTPPVPPSAKAQAPTPPPPAAPAPASAGAAGSESKGGAAAN
ncbi:protein VASP homolog [Punica granatum]|uniref:Protein VASP homolog n=2 Tax=Punica granatum TaxID=22663 RepID=A0A6P8DU47_PUNGR|nr:protein VASP homolog [Punica granatum]